VPKRGRIDVAAQLLDVRPTLLDLAGVKTDAPMMGRSLRPLLQGEATPEWRERKLFASTFQPRSPRYSLTKLPWRLIMIPSKMPSASFELYDVGNDPREKTNRIDEQPQVAIEMIQQLVETWRKLPRVKRESAVELDEAHIERLRALGYLDGESPGAQKHR
jgi:arylsulfatase A-like enzyme